MPIRPFEIDADIRRAETPPAEFYRSPMDHYRLPERVFARGWHPIAASLHSGRGSWAAPTVLLPGVLDEPIALVSDPRGTVRCLSNVCTHRGNLVVESAGDVSSLKRGYHGRRFELDGTFRSMPCFAEVEDFPTERDHLRELPLESFGPVRFVSLDPAVSFSDWIDPARRRLAGLPLDELQHDPAASRSYDVEANWALYVDNYLEGFHIPFVHEELAEAVDLSTYRTELHPYGVLQVGLASEGDLAFELPASHPDFGQRVAAYWWWLFPNTMLNFYPWGLSLNRVEPDGHTRTRVCYEEYLWDASLRGEGAGGDLDRVEKEDGAIVQQVSQGMRSRIYDRGRYSVTQELGVHQFHRLLAEFLFRDDAE